MRRGRGVEEKDEEGTRERDAARRNDTAMGRTLNQSVRVSRERKGLTVDCYESVEVEGANQRKSSSFSLSPLICCLWERQRQRSTTRNRVHRDRLSLSPSVPSFTAFSSSPSYLPLNRFLNLGRCRTLE
jgi:hypothetical protein